PSTEQHIMAYASRMHVAVYRPKALSVESCILNGKMGDEPTESGIGKKIAKFGLESASGLIPFAGGVLSAASSAWSDHEQEKVNSFFQHWLKMLSDEMKEKEQTIVEIAARLDLQDEKIDQRINSPQYQSVLKKAFREWAAAESEDKRKLARNI